MGVPECASAKLEVILSVKLGVRRMTRPLRPISTIVALFSLIQGSGILLIIGLVVNIMINLKFLLLFFRDSCCTITLCDVTLGDHEIRPEVSSALTVNLTDVKVLNSTAIKLKLSAKNPQDVTVEISDNNHVWRQQKPDKGEGHFQDNSNLIIQLIERQMFLRRGYPVESGARPFVLRAGDRGKSNRPGSAGLPSRGSDQDEHLRQGDGQEFLQSHGKDVQGGSRVVRRVHFLLHLRGGRKDGMPDHRVSHGFRAGRIGSPLLGLGDRSSEFRS